MAIYHLETKPIKRSEGRSSVASSAYRAGVALVDERTGIKHDYTKKGGVVKAETFIMHNGQQVAIDRNQLWNTSEKAENRKDGRTGRDYIINIPFELKPLQREMLVREFTEYLAKRFNVAVDWAIHLPDKDGDNRNHHAHVLTTTRTATLDQYNNVVLGDKTTIEKKNGDLKKLGLPVTQEQIKEVRQAYADMTNRHLEMAGLSVRVDCRSYKEQGKDQLPTIKLGTQSSEWERQGIATRKGDYNRLVKQANEENWKGTMPEYIDKRIQDLEQEIIVESRKQNTAQKSPQVAEFERQQDTRTDSTAQDETGLKQANKGQNERGNNPDLSIGRPAPRPQPKPAQKPKLSLEEKMAIWEQKQAEKEKMEQRETQAVSRFEQRMEQHEQQKAERERLEQQRLQQQERQAQLERDRQNQLALQAERERIAIIQAMEQKAREIERENERKNDRGFRPWPITMMIMMMN